MGVMIEGGTAVKIAEDAPVGVSVKLGVALLIAVSSSVCVGDDVMVVGAAVSVVAPGVTLQAANKQTASNMHFKCLITGISGELQNGRFRNLK